MSDKSERRAARKARQSKGRSSRFGMSFVFSLLILAVMLAVVTAGSGVVELLHRLFEITRKIPDVVWLILVSIFLGSVISMLLSHWFLGPIMKLSDAMSKVSGGDFSIRLDTDKGFREVRRIYGDFNTMTQELGATEILQTDFVSNVSHEFKTPITAIEGYATLLQGGAPMSEEQSEYVEKILFNTRRLSSLVGNILLLSKVDNQKIRPSSSTYSLDEQIRQTILALEPRWTERGTEFDVELDSVEYTGSEALMQHVWLNLIENAIKFGPRGGTVRISLGRRDGRIVFAVEDEGPGIPPEAQKHVFDRFYQTDSSHREEGNGLGLALVKQIVLLAGGTVSVENLPERGCRFTVELPEVIKKS